MLKRSFDIVVAVVLLLLLGPAMAAIALWVRLDSAGSIIYRGNRTGRYGQPFFIYKFRTMVPNAERLGGMSTGKNDARITRCGRLLRRYKLDELPQLVNVLKGEMSLVGPRPEMPAYTDLYTDDEQLILTVRPGITDYASLYFIRLDEVLGETNPDQVYEEQVRPVKNALRIQYVREQSFSTDITILLATFRRLLGWKGPQPHHYGILPTTRN